MTIGSSGTLYLIYRSSPDRVKPNIIILEFGFLRRKSKDWLARNQDNVSEWGDMSTRGLLF